MNELTITRIPDEPELEREQCLVHIPSCVRVDGEWCRPDEEGGTGCPASTGSVTSSPTSPASPPTSPAPTQLLAPPLTPEQQLQQIGEAHEKAWRAALVRWYGEKRAEKILARKLCPFCDHKLRPFRDAKTAAQGMRCAGCGREF